MIKTKLVSSIYGKQRIIEKYKGYRRLYVKKIKRTGTWIVSDKEQVSLDSMIEIKGQYHFATLKELHTALNIKG